MGLTNIILSERQLQTELAAAFFYDTYVFLQGPYNIGLQVIQSYNI